MTQALYAHMNNKTIKKRKKKKNHHSSSKKGEDVLPDPHFWLIQGKPLREGRLGHLPKEGQQLPLVLELGEVTTGPASTYPGWRCRL
jgi:hypothetical protein